MLSIGRVFTANLFYLLIEFILSRRWLKVTKFEQTQCHKWALLLQQRKMKLHEAQNAIEKDDFDSAKCLFSEIFNGISGGKQADPGMAGSLLYHMAMVTKMESETRMLLKELGANSPEINEPLSRLYSDFASDAEELTRTVISWRIKPKCLADEKRLGSEEKILLFQNLKQKTKNVELRLLNKNPSANSALEQLFQIWAEKILETRLIQEYETIKGLLTTDALAKCIGLPVLENAMAKVKEKFGQETVSIALDVTLKVGMRREKLQSIMLSDHFISYTMSVEKLDGYMQFLNCPIFGSHKYAAENYGVSKDVAALFCTHFCYAHAGAMLNTVLPFPFTLWQPKRLATHGICEFYLKLAYSPANFSSERFIPLVMSWNLTRECNMKCSHCYINATEKKLDNELSTQEAKNLIDQIAEVSRPLLILSGGEPLLRSDVYELVKYGSMKGLKMGLGSNGSLLDVTAAKKLKEAGIATVSVSLDSIKPEQHDEFRGVPGSWQKAVNAIKALRENNVLMQINTTVTQQNINQIDEIMSLAEKIGVENFHLFFLVPTGRGTKISDISPQDYEDMITSTFAKASRHKLNVRPSCAPQFMRIAKGMGFDMRQWIRGCIAGLYYCRIYPNGDITPCPYLPITLGNIRAKPFRDIWFNSSVFKSLRNPQILKGKCGACEYNNLCGGCRARAYGLSSDFIDYCGDLHEPGELKSDYLAEDPWCVYQPKTTSNHSMGK